MQVKQITMGLNAEVEIDWLGANKCLNIKFDIM
jgi:hypothetical protein